MAKTLVNQIENELQTLMDELNTFRSTVVYLDEAKTSVKASLDSVKNVEDRFANRISEIKSTYNSFIKLQETINHFIDNINSIDFPVRLNNVEKSVSKTIDKLEEIKMDTLEELGKASEKIVKADFDGNFEKIRWEIDKTVKSHYQLSQSFENQRIPEKIQAQGSEIMAMQKDTAIKLNANLETVGNEMVRVINDLDLTAKLDNLASKLSETASRIQSLYDFSERMELNLKEKLNETINNQNKQISTFQANISRKVLEINKMMVKNFGQQRINTLITWIMMFAIIAMIIFFQFDSINPF